MKYPIVNCTKCQREIETIEQFPNGLCVDCWEYATKDKPLKEPDFIGALNFKGKVVNNK